MDKSLEIIELLLAISRLPEDRRQAPRGMKVRKSIGSAGCFTTTGLAPMDAKPHQVGTLDSYITTSSARGYSLT